MSSQCDLCSNSVRSVEPALLSHFITGGTEPQRSAVTAMGDMAGSQGRHHAPGNPAQSGSPVEFVSTQQ